MIIIIFINDSLCILIGIIFLAFVAAETKIIGGQLIVAAQRVEAIATTATAATKAVVTKVVV